MKPRSLEGKPRPHYPTKAGVWARRFAAATILAALAAARAASGAVPLDRWCEVRTPDFRLLSNLQPRRALRLADAVSRFKIAAETLVPPRESLAPPPLRIVAFRRSRHFREAFAAKKVAGFMQSGLARHTLAFGPNPASGDILQVAFHEYAHYLMRSRQGMSYPIWYEEGFASFLSTMRFSDRSVTVGAASVEYFKLLDVKKLKVRRLIGHERSLDWSRHDLPRLYAKAWLLVHMLELGDKAGMPSYRQRLPRLLTLLDAGVPAPEALQTALHAGPDKLEAQLRRYAAKRRLPVRRLAIKTSPLKNFEQRCLSELDAAHELGAAAASRNPTFAAQLLERVVAARPDDADAWAALAGARADIAAARNAAARALAIDARHAAANARMAQLTVAACRGGAANECFDAWSDSARYYRLALREQPDAVDAAYGLGVTYLHTGRAGNALNYLRAAARRAPWAARVNFYLGEAYRLTGDAVRARAHLKRALHWSPSANERERAALALEALDTLQPRDG